jgi:hypothetical protein
MDMLLDILKGVGTILAIAGGVYVRSKAMGRRNDDLLENSEIQTLFNTEQDRSKTP